MTALVFCDGFDKYGPAGNVNAASVMAGDWSVTGTPTIVAPLSTTGYAVNLAGSAGSTALSGTLSSSLTRIVGTFRFSQSISTSLYFGMRNGAANAFSITGNAGGAIDLRTGAFNGTVIASGGTVAVNTTHVLSFDVTIGASSAYAFYLDGVALFSGTGNTGNGQTSVNNMNLTTLSGNLTCDDLALFNPADAAYNASVLTNNVVVETSWPNADAQTQFTNDGNVLWPTGLPVNGVYKAVTGSIISGSNWINLQKVTPTTNCTLNSVSIFVTAGSGVGKVRMLAYADSAGAPGALLSSGTEIVGTGSNVTVTGALTTPQVLTAGTPVWIGFMCDVQIQLWSLDNTTNLNRSKANTYTSGPPSPAGTGYIGSQTFYVYGNCTGSATNAPSVLLNPPLGTAQSQVRSSTVAQEDLYRFPALVTTPSTIYGVAVKGFLAKSDSGVRTVSLNMKSAASDATGDNPSQTLSTTSQWQRTHFDLDPATGLAWTAPGLNAASSGISVAS